MASLPIAMLLLLSLVFVGAFYAVQVNGYNGGDGGAAELVSTVAEQREFDYYSFVVNWPPTVCSKSTKSKCCAQNGCCRGSNSPSIFTIHGLWPNYNNGSWPSCCSGPAFNETEISVFSLILDIFWPTLSCKNSSTCHGKKGSFWAHEWEKHGTCSSPITGGEYNYFVTTIGLYFTYNVTEVLYKAGYVASNTEQYPTGGIISAIENTFHTTPLLRCTNTSLEEVQLCLTKDFKFQKCVVESNCPEFVSLPAFTFSDDLNGTTTADQSFTGYGSS